MTLKDRPERPTRGTLAPPVNTDIDPIDAPKPTAPSTPSSMTTSAPERPQAAAPGLPKLTVQSGVSWSAETEQLVREVKYRTGKTRRAIVEEAIAATWGV